MYLKSSNLKRKIKFNKNYFVYKRNHFGFQCFLCSLFLWISFEWLHFNNSNNRKEDNGRSNIALLPVWMWLKSKSSTHHRYINIIKKAFDSQSVSWPYNPHITARETFACKKKNKENLHRKCVDSKKNSINFQLVSKQKQELFRVSESFRWNWLQSQPFHLNRHNNTRNRAMFYHWLRIVKPPHKYMIIMQSAQCNVSSIENFGWVEEFRMFVFSIFIWWNVAILRSLTFHWSHRDSPVQFVANCANRNEMLYVNSGSMISSAHSISKLHYGQCLLYFMRPRRLCMYETYRNPRKTRDFYDICLHKT